MSMSNKPDASGLTKQERHDIIINYLKSIDKPTKVFHLRWRPGDLLNGQILRSTPMFWFMKYQWSRAQIEEMFFKAKIEIDPTFDQALQQTFGGQPGPRWKGGGNTDNTNNKKWKQRHTQNVIKWKASRANNFKHKPLPTNPNQNTSTDNDDNKSSENTQAPSTPNISTFSNEIWNAISDFGADKSINYEIFSDNLKDRGVNISPFLSKLLFDQLAKPSGTISKQGMEVLIKQLDAMEIPKDFVSVTWDDMASKLGAQMVMKRVLHAAGTSQPFNVDDFIYASKLDVKITPIQYMNKLSDRDVPWDDRLRAMEQLGPPILGTNPLFRDVLTSANLPELLCGWATQIIDNKPEVQKTAIETVAGVFNTAMTLGQESPEVAINHLEEIISNLFYVLDDPNNSKHHPMAKEAISRIVDDVIAINDHESILYLAGILSEICDIEKTSTVPARTFAVEQLKKILFDNADLEIPTPGSVRREWLDTAANIQSSPVTNKTDNNDIKKYARRGPPFAVLITYPKETFPDEPIDFDASKSTDADGNQCVEYTFDFGDGTVITQKEPTIKHKYDKVGVYKVELTVKDKNNETGKMVTNQRVISGQRPDPNSKPATNSTETPARKGDEHEVILGFGKADENECDATNKATNDVEDVEDDEKKYDKPGSDGSADVDGLGKEFRIVMSDVIGKIFEDPNAKIKSEGKKIIDIMKQLNPNWDELLDGSARKKYTEWQFPQKPYPPVEDEDKPIDLKAGDKMVHPVRSDIQLNIENPVLADI